MKNQKIADWNIKATQIEANWTILNVTIPALENEVSKLTDRRESEIIAANLKNEQISSKGEREITLNATIPFT